ncbi:MAG TPA: DUF5996 family protein [Caulobacteraceae bacterium]|nr:DUF5996 family protein [Caulobacteraceae bacterium]
MAKTDSAAWPELPSERLGPTAETLRLMTQVVGKVRLARTPWINHSWHVTLHVTARGLATGPIPLASGAFDLEFDFIAQELTIRSVDGRSAAVRLGPGAIAAFYAEVMAALAAIGAATPIDALPNEAPVAVPFPRDRTARAYDADIARQFWRALVSIDRVFHRFRSRFLGKCSPTHFFWGAADLAVTRFSGRRAPLHPGGVPHLADAVTREAYSHEVSSAGFWAGGEGVAGASFYSYAYPAPEGFAAASVTPAGACFDAGLGEFLLPYEEVRSAADPEAALLGFLQSTYEAAASLGGWDRAALECDEGVPGRPRRVG